jgi:2-polyprenyl-3-methyl-5-hydroxy-6-metoxy-1,4-benzoquinol methylase
LEAILLSTGEAKPVASTIAVEEREAAHWDDVARRLTDDELRKIPELSITDKRRFALLGDLRGKCVLDVGCGSGEWTLMLARAGATVYAIDIAPEMVAVTQRRAKLSGVDDRVIARTMSAMRLEFPDAYFEIVHGQDIIHHLDPGDFGHEVARVLRPGGRAVFRENNGNNAILLWARDNLCGRFGISKWSTDDEYPLTPKRLNAFARNFATICTEYPEFACFIFADAKFFRGRVRPFTQVCETLDRGLHAIPPLRRYSWHQLIVCTR